MRRTITIVALCYALVIFLGFVAVGSIMKVYGYPDSPELQWSALALWLRRHGLLLLALPALWAWWAAAAEHSATRFFSSRGALIAAYALIAVTMALFINAALRPGDPGPPGSGAVVSP